MYRLNIFADKCQLMMLELLNTKICLHFSISKPYIPKDIINVPTFY